MPGAPAEPVSSAEQLISPPKRRKRSTGSLAYQNVCRSLPAAAEPLPPNPWDRERVRGGGARIYYIVTICVGARARAPAKAV